MEISLFYITTGSESEAITLGNLAVENHLAACANIFPMQSIYPWENQMQHEKEFVLILKTIPSLNSSLREIIQEKHSYDLPCIMNWTVEVNEEYGKWVEKMINEK